MTKAKRKMPRTIIPMQSINCAFENINQIEHDAAVPSFSVLGF